MRNEISDSRRVSPAHAPRRWIDWIAPSLLLVGVVSAQVVELNRWTVDGGGAHRAQGGNWELSGTIGQADAGTSASGTYHLSGGFWFEIPPADCDDDGFVGAADAGFFAQCMSGPGVGPRGSCRCFDTDRNGAVDLEDFAELQAGYYGN